MMSAPTSFSGLSAANIATLFGTAASTSDATAKDGVKTSAGTASGAPITGAGGGGTNAAKAIQAIVTQIQVEKSQTNTQGKISTLSLASVAVTYGATLKTDSPQAINVSVTALNSVATATADNTADAIGALLSQVQAQEAQVEAAQGGLLMTKEEEVYGGQASNFVTWTTNSVTLNTAGVAARGVELYEQEGALNGVLNANARAQQFQAPSASAQTTASSGYASSSSSSSGAKGSALYLEITGTQPWEAAAAVAQEQQLVSDFENGALPGQNGTAPENGAGFSYNYSQSADGSGELSDPGASDMSYSIKAVMISNYDSAAVAASDPQLAPGTSRWSFDQNAAMGGTIVGGSLFNGQIRVVIPLGRS